MNHIESVYLESQFTPMAALRRPGVGRRILALHGWLDNAATFLPLMNQLPPDYDFVALDFPGHGHSAHRGRDASYLFADWVREVFAAADALGWDHFHLMGHSMGAGVGALAAVAQPDRVCSLFCLDGFFPMTGADDEAPVRLRDYVRDALRDRRNISFPSEEAALGVRARAGEFEHLEGLKFIVQRNLREENGRFFLRSDRRLHTHNPLRFSFVHLERFARELKLPVGVVIAVNGLDFVKDQVARLAGLVPSFKAYDIPGLHHVHLDAPERIIAPFIDFFQG